MTPPALLLCGASGTGKSTLLTALVPLVPELVPVPSWTTRAPRPGEDDGVEHVFSDDAAFDAALADGRLLGQARLLDARYGLPRLRDLPPGRVPVLSGRTQLAEPVAQAWGCPVLVYELALDDAERLRRLESRDTGPSLARRQETDRRPAATAVAPFEPRPGGAVVAVRRLDAEQSPAALAEQVATWLRDDLRAGTT